VLLSFASNSPKNNVINVNPNIVTPCTMFTGLKTSIGAFFYIVENNKIKITGNKPPKISESGSLNISFKFRWAKYLYFILFAPPRLVKQMHPPAYWYQFDGGFLQLYQ